MRLSVLELLVRAILSQADDRDKDAMMTALADMRMQPDPASDSFTNKTVRQRDEDVTEAMMVVRNYRHE